MTKADRHSPETPSGRSPLEEEQHLCNESLRTGDFDTMSDKEWVAMCEQAAVKKRVAPTGDGHDRTVLAR